MTIVISLEIACLLTFSWPPWLGLHLFTTSRKVKPQATLLCEATTIVRSLETACLLTFSWPPCPGPPPFRYFTKGKTQTSFGCESMRTVGWNPHRLSFNQRNCLPLGPTNSFAILHRVNHMYLGLAKQHEPLDPIQDAFLLPAKQSFGRARLPISPLREW